MMEPRSPHRGAAAALAATALALTVVALVALMFAPAMPLPVRAVVLGVSGVAAPLLTVVALLLLVTPALRLDRRFEAAVVAAAAVAFVADLLFVLSFSAGMDEADAGTARSLFGSLTWLFALTSAAGFATLTALLLFLVFRRPAGMPRRPAIVASIVAALLAAPFLVWSISSPLTAVLPALAVAIVALVPPRPRGHPDGTTPAARLPRAAGRLLVPRVRTLALAGLGYTVVVWAGAIGTSIAATGTDGASSALGVAAGAAQLAVVPLLVAGSLVAEAHTSRRRTLWIGTAVALAGVCATSTAMVVGFDPDGDLFVQRLAVIGVAVGAWATTIAWTVTARLPSAARVAAASVALVGGSVVYLFMVALSAGIPLALVGAFLVLGGARRLLRVAPATSPATLPASP
jgi:hypothetical protein